MSYDRRGNLTENYVWASEGISSGSAFRYDDKDKLVETVRAAHASATLVWEGSLV
jgi:hypothetical protein